MKLGDQHIHKFESLNVEFKEFCLNLNEDDFDCLNIEKISKTGILDDNEKIIINNMILSSIKNYFIKYIPRYLSAFLNSNIDNAEMHIGVDDYGEITGIPFFGSKEEFEKFIYNIIKLPLYYTKTKGKNVDYKIIVDELVIDKNLLVDTSDEILKTYYNDKHLATITRKKYIIERRKWASALSEYTCKLPLLLEYKKKEFHNYLMKHAPHMINYKIYSHEMRNIAHLKANPNHYLYWLMLFKEQEIDKLQRIKPQKPKIPKINQGPYFLLNNLTELRTKFINNNNEIKYFVIKIVFPSKANEYDTVYYYNLEGKTWLTKERHYHVNVGPCCL